MLFGSSKQGKPIRGKIIFRIDQSLYHSSLRAEETTGGEMITRMFIPAFFDSFFNFLDKTISSPAKWVSGNPPARKQISSAEDKTPPQKALIFGRLYST